MRLRTPASLTLMLGLTSLFAAAEKASTLYVGTYTDKGSKGIYGWHFDEATGKVQPLGLMGASVNPSFLALSPDGKRLIAVNETGEYKGRPGGSVSSFSIGVDGKLTLLSEAPSGGAHPCYVTLDAGAHHALVSNYTGGSVSVLPLDAKGQWGEATAFQPYTGKGPNAQRQEAAHAHSINLSPDGKFALVADLGTDLIHLHRYDSRTGTLKPADIPFARTAPGAGPRHLTFSPNGHFAYVLNELQGSLTTYAWDAKQGALIEKQTVSTLPPHYDQPNTCAEVRVHPSGKFVYASNRGHDSIAVFKVQKDGRLDFVEHVSTGGKAPRNFVLSPSGKWLLAANQGTDNVVVFRIDPQTGKLSPSGETFTVSSPVCLRFSVKR